MDGPERPKMIDLEWMLFTIDSHDRSGVRCAMGAASQLPGRGPTEDVAPVLAHTCTLIKIH